MDITDVISTEYVSFDPGTRVSKLVGAFEDPEVPGAVVVDDGEVEGVVTRRQLAASHRHPDEKVGGLVWHVPKVGPDEDVREVARLVIESGSRLLPVVEGRDLVGVVTVDGILEAVRPYLDVVRVDDACSPDLVTTDPEATVGEALNVLREEHITHLPVVEDGRAVGLLSLHDLTEFAVREMAASQGGIPEGFDAHGGEGSRAGYGSHGGFGAREGELDRMLDLPVRDVMASPVLTVERDRHLDEAVGEMFEAGASSLVVVGDDGVPEGIVTKTDAIESLTWEAEGNRAVQVYGADLMDDVTYEEVAEMVEAFDHRDGGMSVLDAKVHLHEHDETRRGVSLLLARIRLYTDRGLYVASGEGYGARHAINEARSVLERRIRDEKTRGRSKKHPDEEFWERRFGWWLS